MSPMRKEVRTRTRSPATSIRAGLSAPARHTPPSEAQDEDNLFNLQAMRYPWPEGEVPAPDILAARLRETQRLHGIPAVRDEILHLIGRYARTGLAHHRLAKMLDVPPAIIPKWLAAKERRDRDHVTALDALGRVARDLYEIEDDLRQIRERLVTDRGVGDRVFSELLSQAAKLREQRAKLLSEAGLDMRIAPPLPPEEAEFRLNIQAVMGGTYGRLAEFVYNLKEGNLTSD